ncbi:hypothetical protein C0J52_15202 [Blattella germanica]|nr:hypothetical protein C0J52_15202 [Blattella germanica]
MLCSSIGAGDQIQEPPEGYYAFVESPNAEPPRVKRPPYVQTDKECPGSNFGGPNSHSSLYNLCGDLNKGIIPRNPMGQKVMGASYPFELVKNKTLEFFSRTLPILKADETLPRVAKYSEEASEWNTDQLSSNSISPDHRHRTRRDTEEEPKVEEVPEDAPRHTDDKTAFNGESLAPGIVERRDEFSGEAPEYRRGEGPSVGPINGHHDPSLPPTPCPAKVDYATPVFAKNYQGVWRYVVQIPYEGYFTQTIEVTRCLYAYTTTGSSSLAAANVGDLIISHGT